MQGRRTNQSTGKSVTKLGNTREKKNKKEMRNSLPKKIKIKIKLKKIKPKKKRLARAPSDRMRPRLVTELLPSFRSHPVKGNERIVFCFFLVFLPSYWVFCLFVVTWFFLRSIWMKFGLPSFYWVFV